MSEIVNEKKDYELYGASTSNVYKIRIMFELLGVTFNFHNVDIMKGEQFKPEFLALNPNNKVPVIVDNTVEPPFVVFESGAILIYLAEKYGKLLPTTAENFRERSSVIQWVVWQVSTLGPYMGQYFHFLHLAPEKIPYAIERYSKETDRIYKVLDGELSKRKYVATNELTIADISVYGWALYLRLGVLPEYDTLYPNVFQWLNRVEERIEFTNSLNLAKESFAKRAAALATAATTIVVQSKQE